MRLVSRQITTGEYRINRIVFDLVDGTEEGTDTADFTTIISDVFNRLFERLSGAYLCCQENDILAPDEVLSIVAENQLSR